MALSATEENLKHVIVQGLLQDVINDMIPTLERVVNGCEGDFDGCVIFGVQDPEFEGSTNEEIYLLNN